MAWDWTIRITDIIMIVAVAAGPIIAVQVTEYLRHKKDSRDRRVHIFRTLMATRSAQLAPMHIEALNLVELEFQASPRSSKQVVNAGRLYVDHLGDHAYPKEAWGTRKDELLVDLLYEMSTALGYNFDKVQIKAGSYYPSGYGEAENDNLQIRKLWLDILKGNRKLPMTAEVYPSSNAVIQQQGQGNVEKTV
jgi:hypothetical protein